MMNIRTAISCFVFSCVAFFAHASISPSASNVDEAPAQETQAKLIELGDQKEKAGFPKEALYLYSEAAQMSLQRLQLIGSFEDAFCTVLTFKSAKPEKKLTQCALVNGETRCQEVDAIDVVQCADTKNLCESISRVWKAVSKTADIIIINEETCTPYGGSP